MHLGRGRLRKSLLKFRILLGGEAFLLILRRRRERIALEYIFQILNLMYPVDSQIVQLEVRVVRELHTNGDHGLKLANSTNGEKYQKTTNEWP